jgi:hypothetical protein
MLDVSCVVGVRAASVKVEVVHVFTSVGERSGCATQSVNDTVSLAVSPVMVNDASVVVEASTTRTKLEPVTVSVADCSLIHMMDGSTNVMLGCVNTVN